MTTIAERIDAHTPPTIRAFSEWFCEFYEIDGLCDPMYICNVVAMMKGLGDGCGQFWPDPKDAQDDYDIYKRLTHAYSTCIHDSRRETSYVLDAIQSLDRKPHSLQCCCCGENTRGRQWWNRDTGYGLCPDCVPLWERDGAENLVSTNGIKGIHFAIDG